MFRQILSLLFLFSFFSLQSQEIYFPPTFGNWETVAPTTLNWCDEPLDSLQQFLDDKHSKAFIILKDGRIAVEWYFDDFTQDSLWYWASAGKTVTATLIGIAQEEGLLSIDNPTSDYLGQGWTNCSLTEENEITVRHQLTMTTGLADNLFQWECTQANCLSCLQAPDTRWSYYNAPYTLLGDVLESVSDVSLNNFFATRIGNKIGAFGAFIPLGYNRVFLSRARSMARFGLLILAQGQWNGMSVLGDQTYYQAMISPSQSLNPSYGYLWWLNGQSSYMVPASQTVHEGSLIPPAPADMFAALGKNDQKIYVVPSQNLVVIRMGEDASESTLALSGFDDELWERINNLSCVTAVEDEPVDDSSVLLYPNPVNDALTVEAKDVIRLSLFNTNGQVVKMQNPAETQKITFQRDFPAGIYWLKIEFTSGRIEWKRVVKI